MINKYCSKWEVCKGQKITVRKTDLYIMNPEVDVRNIFKQLQFSNIQTVAVHHQDSSFSTNPLLAQMPSTVHLYHMLQTYGIHSPRGLVTSYHSVLLKLMFCIIYNYFTYTLTIILYVHFVLAQAIYLCILCTFLHKNI